MIVEYNEYKKAFTAFEQAVDDLPVGCFLKFGKRLEGKHMVYWIFIPIVDDEVD